ncbi:primosomal protein N' [Candidatus Tisiphia endosymbiont of Nemotelus uliginosus]|uniref:primosomal protein N' n=1 Tax=Candidatus Tisiphia endosymbiont of Nemotelus uliginosus TaxID=3077926 RepID=UPI0035C911ED
MQVARILLPLAKLFPLDYYVPAELKLTVGDLVVVPFRNKELMGIVWELDVNLSAAPNKIKSINQKIPLEFRLNQEILQLIHWAANYYMAELGSIAKLVLPVDISQGPIKVKHQDIKLDFSLPPLLPNQQNVLSLVTTTNKPTIIKGVTGSGKTEIYFHLITDYLKQGKQILIMLPEIALSQQIISRFIERFNFSPIIWNSTVTKAQKKAILRGILSNDIRVIIGARSSLFLPYNNLGLIIIDEEHDSSYKQEDGILYNARDSAVLRSTLSKGPTIASSLKVVLCSATPSIETMYNASQGKYQLIELLSRYLDSNLPEVQIIDMRREKLPKNSYLSPGLITAMRKNLVNKEQILLFLNRRGYSPLLLCKLCGYRFTCNCCSAWLVVHKLAKKLECHHCGYQGRILRSCPECEGEDSLTMCGPGVERIEEEVRDLFPQQEIVTFSKDYSQKPERIRELLHKMEHSNIDILIGTQMITKGYHFPNLTLVGIIDADLGNINNGDLSSTERNYQLLHQVGGRAGREGKKGLVLLQTYYPDNIIFNYLTKGDNQFLQYELQTREMQNMPPFTKMASIILSGKDEYKVLEIARKLVTMAPISTARILGPSRALMSKLAGKYRYRILIIAAKQFNLQKLLAVWLSSVQIPSYCHLKIDIDPKSFY